MRRVIYIYIHFVFRLYSMISSLLPGVEVMVMFLDNLRLVLVCSDRTTNICLRGLHFTWRSGAGIDDGARLPNVPMHH